MFLSTCWLPAGFFISGCNIVSVESPLASTLNVKWSSYSGATVYLLDLRVVNSTTTTPVVVMTTAPSTGRLVQGLQPGRHYRITMKVFQYTTIACTDFMEAMTGKKKKKNPKETHTKGMKRSMAEACIFCPPQCPPHLRSLHPELFPVPP